jgi:L,D-transpeptidase catalytic domain/Putative peptidoglycan binding domain/LysM domain
MSAVEATTRQANALPRNRTWLLMTPVLIVILLALSGLAVAALFERRFADRIYPGIQIGNYDVGGMTEEEAAGVVQQYYARMLAVFDFQGTQWFAPWHDVGIIVNAREAALQAYMIARDGRPDMRLNAWQERQPILVTFGFDSASARSFLEMHSAEVYVAPQESRVVITDGVAGRIEAVNGRELDVDTTLQDAFARILKDQPVPVHVRVMTPTIGTADAAAQQLNAWLGSPFALSMWWNNALITRTVTPVERTGWVQATTQADRIVASLNPQGIHATLAQINAELGPEADMRLDEATAMVQNAMNEGAHSVWFVVPHSEIRYVVKRGDTFDSVGDHFGIPVSRILAANPDIWDNGGFVIGQAITVPAQSIMLPQPIAAGNRQRIEVDLTTQSLFAYDGETRVLSTAISSGIPKWRTLIGVFQVEEKVDDAYNKLAHIHMPNWLSIYDIGDPGNSLTNGIHALPVLGGGSRLWAGYLGHPVSFGCIVMGIEESDWLYKWVQIGTPVIVYGTTPPSALTYDNLIEAQQKTQQTP